MRLRAPDSRGVRHILFFLVPEPRTAKSRVHLDLADPDPEASVARLVALGATEVARHAGHGTAGVVMTDPEGNEFCIG